MQSESRAEKLLGALVVWPRWLTIALPVLLVLLYQRLLRPLLPGACRFYPTCSDYAILALRRHGLLRGGALAVWRLLRCHPFHPGGVDPVPTAGDRR